MAAAAVVIAGCGGNDADKPARTVTVPAGGAVQITADEYAFDPGKLVASPGTLRISLTNEGSLPHDLRVRRDGESLGGTPVIEGGRAKTASVELESGSYEFFCSVGDHEELGMRGQIEVE